VNDTTAGCPNLVEALSARIDGEDPGLDQAVIDAHLARCPECRLFEQRARAQHRRFRVRTATGVPDLSARILASIPTGPSPRQRVTVGNRGLSTPLFGAAAVVVAAVLVAGYLLGTHLGGGGGSGDVAVTQIAGSTQSSAAYPGATVMPASQVVAKPDVTLTDTAGQPYDMAAATAGRVTLLYFGYTHCPDVCPLIMAYLAQALKTLPTKVSSQVDVVFVTVDPARDTPQVLHSWLSGIDPSYVGLTGTIQQIIGVEKASGVPATQVETSALNGYTIQHSAEVLAFSRDDKAHVLFDSSTLPADYEHDLKLLVKGTT
jgi:protein SCO1/2